MTAIKTLEQFGLLSKKYPFTHAAEYAMKQAQWTSVELLNDIDTLWEDGPVKEAALWLKQNYGGGNQNVQGWNDYVDTLAARVSEMEQDYLQTTNIVPVKYTDEVITFNFSGNSNVAKMMQEDNLPHNNRIKLSQDRLFELSNKYDITVCVRNKTTYLFLSEQTEFLPKA